MRTRELTPTVIDGKSFLNTLDRTLVMRVGVGATARIIQRTALTFPRLAFDRPILILVNRGTKLIRWQGGSCKAEAGDAVALASGNTFDISNELSSEGVYEALWLVWDRSLVAARAEKRPLDRRAVERACVIKRTSSSFAAACAAAMSAIADPDQTPETVAKHRMEEVLLWLEENDASLNAPEVRSMESRVRQLLSSDLARQWAAAEVAEHLSVSGATLRRHLAADGLSLRQLLVDVRMSHALTMLQCTDFSIVEIALGVGYDSASRFAVRFRKRFGCSPSNIRTAKRA